MLIIYANRVPIKKVIKLKKTVKSFFVLYSVEVELLKKVSTYFKLLFEKPKLRYNRNVVETCVTTLMKNELFEKYEELILRK